jgi:serine/threonine protein kinase
MLTPLLQYAEGLSVRQRLELFPAVCQAVDHADHRSIVHRDIRPANTL